MCMKRNVSWLGFLEGNAGSLDGSFDDEDSLSLLEPPFGCLPEKEGLDSSFAAAAAAFATTTAATTTEAFLEKKPPSKAGQQLENAALGGESSVLGAAISTVSSSRMTLRKREARREVKGLDLESDIVAEEEQLQEQQQQQQQQQQQGAAAGTGRRRNVVSVALSREEDHRHGEDSDDHEEDGEDSGELSYKRARNREHAKKSRNRKKERLEGLEEKLLKLRKENMRLLTIVKRHLPDEADQVLEEAKRKTIAGSEKAAKDVLPRSRPRGRVSRTGQGLGSDDIGSRVPSALQLMENDRKQVELLSRTQQALFLTDPSLTLLYVSEKFLSLVGHEEAGVLGQNLCMLLRGPSTTQTSIDIVNNNVAASRDTTLCFVSYRANGTPFWMQLYLGALRSVEGDAAVNFVGVCCEVEGMSPPEFHRRLNRVPLPPELLVESGDQTK